jgi:hypothetical protein
MTCNKLCYGEQDPRRGRSLASSIGAPGLGGAGKGTIVTDETPFVPVTYLAKAGRRVAVCGGKRSPNQPTCDGSHRTLS